METIIKSNDYQIYLGEDSLIYLKDYLAEKNYSQLFILVDENTHQFCLPVLQKELSLPLLIIEIKSGEEHKNLDTCTYVWKELAGFGADRNALLINLGGGVIGDLGGFVASTYKRGIDFINIPTTLLAQVDASVGGKLGVDLDGLKNMVGLFANPRAVFIYPAFFQTLPAQQLLSGFAEIIKHALIADADYWQELQNVKKIGPALAAFVQRSIEIKNEVVTTDPKEKGLRKILNFGHTIGHAVETFSLLHEKEPLLHGEAVALGIPPDRSSRRRMLRSGRTP